MAAKHQDFGVQHLTVVPTNFQQDDADEGLSREERGDRPA